MKGIGKLSVADAKARTGELKRQARDLESGWLTLGREVRKCLADGIPGLLGMSATDWMTSTFGASLARLKRARRMEAALSGLATEKLKLLTEGNAYSLTKLPEKQRKDPEWVEKAIRMPVAEFKNEVEDERHRITGMPQEQFSTFWVRLPDSVYQQMMDAEAKVAESLGVEILDGKDGNRIMVWERIACDIIQTPAELLFTGSK